MLLCQRYERYGDRLTLNHAWAGRENRVTYDRRAAPSLVFQPIDRYGTPTLELQRQHQTLFLVASCRPGLAAGDQRLRIPATYSAAACMSASRIRPAMACICVFFRSPVAKFFKATSVYSGH